jgi:hypothetical protein
LASSSARRAWSRDFAAVHRVDPGECELQIGLCLLIVHRLLLWEWMGTHLSAARAWVARMNEQTLSTIRARLDESAFAEKSLE